MKKILIPSLIFSFLMCLMYVLSYRQILPSTNTSLVFLLILSYGIVFFVLMRSIKNKYYKESAKFGILFKHGFFIAVISTLLSSLFAFVYLTYIDKDALNRQKEIGQNAMQEQLEKMGDDSIAFKRNMKDVVALTENPKDVTLMNIPVSIFMYSVFAFFSAAILRTRIKEPEETA